MTNLAELDKFISDFLDCIENYSIRNMRINGKPPINWDRYRKDVLEFMAKESPSSIDEADNVMRYALRKLEDGEDMGHSHLPTNTQTSMTNPEPRGQLIGAVAYICIPQFGNTPAYSPEDIEMENKDHAQKIQNIISKLEERNPTGWVLDLRINHGGSCWPMIVGLGPLLGNGIHGHFIGHHETMNAQWGYENGKGLYNKETFCQVEHPYVLKKKNPPIAILMGEGTCSSGEAVLVAFHGLPNAKTFGGTSFGNSTSVAYIADSRKPFCLTTALYADRNKNIVDFKIEPDFKIPETSTFEQQKKEDYKPGNDPLVQTATGWIHQQRHPSSPALKPWTPSC